MFHHLQSHAGVITRLVYYSDGRMSFRQETSGGENCAFGPLLSKFWKGRINHPSHSGKVPHSILTLISNNRFEPWWTCLNLVISALSDFCSASSTQADDLLWFLKIRHLQTSAFILENNERTSTWIGFNDLSDYNVKPSQVMKLRCCLVVDLSCYKQL